jgi:hypothetical protein
MYIYTTMKRKYNVNDNYFNKIDNEEKAYWLGFLLADGCIHERAGQDRLSLVLSIKDKDHLEKFKKSLSFEGPINDYTKKSGLFIGLEHSFVRITSQLLVNDLARVGCVPRKSLTLEFPIINDSLVHHFIRGYFDGDGSVFISKEKHWRSGNISQVIHFRFIGTEAFLKVLDKKINLSGRLVQAKGSRVYELCYKRNKKAQLFYNYLYEDATIFLERKEKIFKLHLQEKGSETIIS